MAQKLSCPKLSLYVSKAHKSIAIPIFADAEQSYTFCPLWVWNDALQTAMAHSSGDEGSAFTGHSGDSASTCFHFHSTESGRELELRG
jgi:hypothetical protein